MLLAVCFWLIYQVKHSHDKSKHFDEHDGEVSEKLSKFDEVITLGRKDLHPRDEELSKNHEKIDDEEVEDEETLGKGDEISEETQVELERKRKEEGSADIEALLDGTSRGEGAGGRVGDDDIDEQDLDKAEKEADGNEDVLEGDKDIEKDEENETEGKDGDEDNEDEQQPENDGSLTDQDMHGAREEHYKADDAFSSVAHVGQNIISENPERKNLTSDSYTQELDDSIDETDVANEQHLNATNILETPRLEDNPDKSDTDTNEARGGTVDSTILNDKGRVLGLTPDQNSTTESLSDEKSSNVINGPEHNSTVTSNTTDTELEQDDNSTSTMNHDISASDSVVASTQTTTATNQTDPFNSNDHEDDAIQERKDTEEDSILSSLNDDETLRDPLISEDKERESLIDLDSLPELRTEGTDLDDAVTE